MSTLVIVESPSKAKTIEKYLGKGFEVEASVGHVRDLPKSNKKAIDIDGGFIPHYEISKGKERVVGELARMAKKSKQIYLATDPDREGEAISWHLKMLLKDAGVKTPMQRIAFHEITEKAVNEAILHPREIDSKLVKAQEARRVLDRLVGYDLSGLIWKKVRYGLSAGRVQSPALRIIMEREREIRAFIPTAYFEIDGIFKTKAGENLPLSCKEVPTDKKRAEQILEAGKKESWVIQEIKQGEVKRSPKAPFTTSTIQQTASSRLGFSPSRTMQIAQKLYEAGHITYMRTDSTNLSKDAQKTISNLIISKYGKEYSSPQVYKTKSKNAQEAHEAIRPTHIEHLVAGNNEEQKRLYKLIWERTVASQMSDAILNRSTILANVEKTDVKDFPDFSGTASQIKFDGWIKVDPDARGEDVFLPEVKTGESLKVVELNNVEKETLPPNRYSEAGLVKELETRGIGRPSTYASIIRTIEERGYVTKEGRTLIPTDTGDVVSSFLEKHFADYISDTFTAEMEDKLDDISIGKREYEKTLKEFYTPFIKEVKSKDKLEKATNLGEAPEDMLCPVCKGAMIIKLSKNGKFYSCAKYPDCVGARTIEGHVMEGPKEIGEMCPDCGEKHQGKLVLREGRFGAFISCSRYPKCKFIKEDEEEKKKKMTGVICPTCGKGEMMERRGRFGIFYSCSNYPDCKNAIKAKPTGAICKMCESLMMEGTKTIPDRCSNNKCPNHRPDRLNKK